MTRAVARLHRFHTAARTCVGGFSARIFACVSIIDLPSYLYSNVHRTVPAGRHARGTAWRGWEGRGVKCGEASERDDNAAPIGCCRLSPAALVLLAACCFLFLAAFYSCLHACCGWDGGRGGVALVWPPDPRAEECEHVLFYFSGAPADQGRVPQPGRNQPHSLA